MALQLEEEAVAWFEKIVEEDGIALKNEDLINHVDEIGF